MSMPTIPEEPHRPSQKETIIDLMESIALEEIALSHILNAEAQKIQAFVGTDLDFPTCPTNKEILQFNRSVNQLMDTVLMKEWLLLRKFQNVMDFHNQDKEKDSRSCECHVYSCFCSEYYCKPHKKHNCKKCKD